MRFLQRKFGQLDCHVVQLTDAAPTYLGVLCHGYGASGADLTSIASTVAASLGPVADTMAFVFPQGPLNLAHDGPNAQAWWPIDMAAMAQPGKQSERLEDMRRTAPPGMSQARRFLRETLEAVLQSCGLGYDRLILGGFSQGAMLAGDVALRLEEAPAGLALLSAGLVDEPALWRLAPLRRGLCVMQSHGRHDPILPFALAEVLRDILVSSGLLVDFCSFEGGHTIPPLALGRLVALLRRVTASENLKPAV